MKRNLRLMAMAGVWLAGLACLPGVSITFGPTQTPQNKPAAPNMAVTATRQPPTMVPEPTGEGMPQLLPTLTPTEMPGMSRVKIYLVALEDNGVSGERIGCGDSLVPVEVRIAPTLGVLRAALNALFKLQGQQFYGESGLYNALYQSALEIQDVAVVGGEARIALKGNLALGGVCDAPRVQAQLEALALQFSTVERVNITVNGQPLQDLLSLK